MITDPENLETSIEKKVLTLQTILEFSLALNSATTLKQVYDIIMRTCMGHNGIEVTALMLGNYPPSREFVLKSVRGVDPGLVERKVFFSEAMIEKLYGERHMVAQEGFSGESLETRSLLEQLETCIIVPVLQQERLIGLLSCSPKVSSRPYSDEDIEFLQLINSHAGIAINNIITMDSLVENNLILEKKLYDLKAVEDISRTISATLDLKQVCHRLLLTVMGHLAAESGLFYLHEAGTFGLFRLVTSSGKSRANLTETIQLSPHVLDQLFQEKFSEKRAPLQKEIASLLQSLGVTVCLPVGFPEEVTGLCFLGSRATGLPYKPNDLSLAALLVAQVVSPVRNSQYYQQICENNLTLKDANAKLKQEIFDRKKAEGELLRLGDLLSDIIDSMPSLLVGVKPDGCIMQWNREAEKMTGVSFEEARGRLVTELFPWLTGEMDRIRQAIALHAPFKDEKVLRIMDGGELKYWDIDVYPLSRGRREGAVIRVDDVTERVRMEEMMIQTEKILSIGGLAAGMAHEINNPLAGIIQNIQVMQNRVKAGLPKNKRIAEECGTDIRAIENYMERREVLDMIDFIVDSGRRAARIVDNMLSFSRKSDNTGLYMNDVRKLLDQTVELYASDYDLKKKYDFRQIEIVREYDPDLPDVPCDGSKIQQVFLNILRNGAQAMADQVKAGRPPRFTLRIKRADATVRIEIEDNGPGMTKEVRRRIFEPFFTTKEKGGGTGLGLSVSYFIVVENHKGTMTVESVPGKGTNFIIHLPLGPAA